MLVQLGLDFEHGLSDRPEPRAKLINRPVMPLYGAFPEAIQSVLYSALKLRPPDVNVLHHERTCSLDLSPCRLKVFERIVATNCCDALCLGDKVLKGEEGLRN